MLTVTDKKVTWEAVENASGYIVSVNGVSGEVTKDTSYDLSAAAQGDYEVTVKAVGDGAPVCRQRGQRPRERSDRRHGKQLLFFPFGKLGRRWRYAEHGKRL